MTHLRVSDEQFQLEPVCSPTFELRQLGLEHSPGRVRTFIRVALPQTKLKEPARARLGGKMSFVSALAFHVHVAQSL
eukprot:5549278-Prymnesium_polylepis.1